MSTDPIRWLHLSDFHVGKDHYEERKIFEYIHDHVREQCERGFIPDLVFITGDIANYGIEDEYLEFAVEFLYPLKEALGGADWKGRIFAVPGNHDLQRKFVEDVSRENHLQAESKFFRADDEGLDKRRLYELRAFEEFGKFTVLSDLNPENWLDSKTSALLVEPFDLKGKTIGIVGINTAWLSRDDQDERQLSPGIDLLESALKTIKSCDLRILLGHHPISWFTLNHRERIQNAMGDYNILYLHGHLHENRSQPMETGGGKFLQIQSGAAFNVLEQDETRWKNGILWAEIGLDLTNIRLQPRYWKSKQRRWGISDDLHEDRRIDGNWWAYPLPNTKKFSELMATEAKKEKELLINLPEGWKIIDEELIRQHSQRELSSEIMLHYFDGAIPLWHRDFLHAIPERNIVGEIVITLQKNRDLGRSSLLLLSGAGGEGKSTALLQSALKLFESGEWNLLWHAFENKPLSPEFLRGLPDAKPWLIFSDDGDLLVEDLQNLLPWLTQNRQDIHFLIASRQSDWHTVGGTRIGWSQYCIFREITLGKLEPDEAEAIVGIWSAYGEAGLKSLNGIALHEAAEKLKKASEDEAGKGEGAFLGAMLKIRLADGLKDHVKLMLSRLAKHQIGRKGKHTLLDAFAAIALMHAEGFDFFSAPVCAQYLFSDPAKTIRGPVLSPLGREAAAVRAGQFLFTRHTSIAKTAAELLEKDFGIDSAEIFSSLGASAIEAAKNGAYVPPNLAKWRYDFPNHFIEIGRKPIALAIGKAQLGIDPGDALTLINLASLYRKSGLPEIATNLFRDFKGNLNRGFFYDWGTSEGSSGNHVLAVWLSAASLSDWRFSGPPSHKDTKLGLAGLGVAFAALYNAHYDPVFRDARRACAILGLKLYLDSRAEKSFQKGYAETSIQGAPEMNLDQAFEAFAAGVNLTWEYLDRRGIDEERIPSPTEMTFEGLKNLIHRAIAREQTA